MEFGSRKHSEFFSELKEEGYHIFSRQNASTVGFYPNVFPSFPLIPIERLQADQTVTIRVFFAIGDQKHPTVESGTLSLEIEYIDLASGSIFANIVTQLPTRFCLKAGTTLELDIDEILTADG